MGFIPIVHAQPMPENSDMSEACVGGSGHDGFDMVGAGFVGFSSSWFIRNISRVMEEMNHFTVNEMTSLLHFHRLC